MATQNAMDDNLKGLGNSQFIGDYLAMQMMALEPSSQDVEEFYRVFGSHNSNRKPRKALFIANPRPSDNTFWDSFREAERAEQSGIYTYPENAMAGEVYIPSQRTEGEAAE